MNNYLSRTYNPGLSSEEPFDRLAKLQRPSLTVQFLLMTQTGDFAVSDHTHVEGWGGGDRAPAVAATQIDTAKYGGPQRAAASVANWGFTDGHAETLRFGQVYSSRDRNAFNPEVAQLTR